MKMKIVAKNQKVLLHQMGTDHALEEIVESFHHPFPKVLHPVRHRLDFPGRHLSKDDYSCGDDPGYEHGVCYREFSQGKKRLGLQRKRFVLFRRAAGAGANSAAFARGTKLPNASRARTLSNSGNKRR